MPDIDKTIPTEPTPENARLTPEQKQPENTPQKQPKEIPAEKEHKGIIGKIVGAVTKVMGAFLKSFAEFFSFIGLRIAGGKELVNRIVKDRENKEKFRENAEKKLDEKIKKDREDKEKEDQDKSPPENDQQEKDFSIAYKEKMLTEHPEHFTDEHIYYQRDDGTYVEAKIKSVEVTDDGILLHTECADKNDKGENELRDLVFTGFDKDIKLPEHLENFDGKFIEFLPDDGLTVELNGVVYEYANYSFTTSEGQQRISGFAVIGVNENCNPNVIQIPPELVIEGKHEPVCVNVIEKEAFKGHTAVKIMLPPTISDLEEGCFRDMKELRGVNIKDTQIRNLPKNMFTGCDYIEDLSLPDSFIKNPVKRITGPSKQFTEPSDQLINVVGASNITQINNLPQKDPNLPDSNKHFTDKQLWEIRGALKSNREMKKAIKNQTQEQEQTKFKNKIEQNHEEER